MLLAYFHLSVKHLCLEKRPGCVCRMVKIIQPNSQDLCNLLYVNDTSNTDERMYIHTEAHSTHTQIHTKVCFLFHSLNAWSGREIQTETPTKWKQENSLWNWTRMHHHPHGKVMVGTWLSGSGDRHQGTSDRAGLEGCHIPLRSVWLLSGSCLVLGGGAVLPWAHTLMFAASCQLPEEFCSLKNKRFLPLSCHLTTAVF